MTQLYLITGINLLITLVLITLLSGCEPGEETGDRSSSVDGNGISIEGAWARPGSMGRMSAGYFLVTNFEDEPDTLKGVYSNVAQLTEIHESYEQEEGMVGMREVSEVVIQPNSTVSFEPGGLHVMFIQLTEALAENEDFELTLHFSNAGDVVLEIPVRN